MDENSFKLADYYDLLDAAFPAAMKEEARKAAHRKFISFVREQNLSTVEAVLFLQDKDFVRNFKKDAEAAVPQTNAQSAKKEVARVITKLGSDIDFVKDAVVNFTELGLDTRTLVAEIGRSVAETKASTADSKKTIEEIHAAAAHLQEVLTQAADKTNIIVEKMETIPPRLDAQLQKIEGLEKGVEAAEKNSGEAKKNTDPGETWKQGLKLMWHSVAWGTVASTLCGAGVGAIITHYSTKAVQPKPEPEKEAIIERVIEREVFPKTLVLRDKTGKIVYTLEVAPQKESTSAVGSVHTPSNDTYAPKSEKPPQKKRKVPNLLLR